MPETIKQSRLPEPQYSQLFGFLRKLLHNDLYTLDSFFLASRSSKATTTPNSNNSNNNNDNKDKWSISALPTGSYDQSIRAAFLLFFVSVFRDYRNYLSYLRVFPEPMVVFNKRLFLNSKQYSQVHNITLSLSLSLLLLIFCSIRIGLKHFWRHKCFRISWRPIAGLLVTPLTI